MTPPTDPTRWSEVKRLFEAALDRPEPSREAFLDAACRQPDGRPDAELRAAVETLLRADADADATDGFLVRAPMGFQSLLHSLRAELAEASESAWPSRRDAGDSPTRHER